MGADKRGADVLQHADADAEGREVPHPGETDGPGNANGSTHPGAKACRTFSEFKRFLGENADIAGAYVEWGARMFRAGRRVTAHASVGFWNGRVGRDGRDIRINNNWTPLLHRFLADALHSLGFPLGRVLRCIEFRSPCQFDPFFPTLFPSRDAGGEGSEASNG